MESVVCTTDLHARPHSEPGLDGRGSSCHLSCPELRPNSKYARLAAWLDHVHAWEPRHKPRDEIPSLYRFRADCVREHFVRRSSADEELR